MSRQRQKKDKTGIVISVVAHIVVIGAVLFFLSRTKMGQELLRRTLQAVRSQKETVKEPPKQTQAKPPPTKLPPINQGAPPSAASGARRAVSSDAPAAVGESFFADTRTQEGASAKAGGPQQQKEQQRMLPPPPKPPPRIELRPPVSTAKGSTAKLLTERQAAQTVSDSIGAEAIDRSTSSDAGDVVAKVTGTSIVDGKFAVVRGLSDRYTATTLNGAEIPTPDPYRRQVQLDIFPAKMISAINVTKTFTPDLIGSFAGGLIDVQTKSFPDKFNFSFTAGVGYNPNVNLRGDFLGYHGGGLDFLGMDDGTRELPAPLKNLKGLPEPPLNAARLETPAQSAARRAQAEKVAFLTRSFKESTLAPFDTHSSVNQSYNFSMGDTVRMLERPLGFFFGVDYKNSYSGYQDGTQDRISANGSPVRRMVEQRGIHEVTWSGVASLAWQPLPDHEIGFNFLYNQSGEDTTRHAEGQNLTTGSPDQTLILNNINYVERNLTTFQLKGSHLLAEVKNLKIDWVGALSDTRQYEPDQRFFYYYSFPQADGSTGNLFNNSLPQPQRPTRFFRDITENNKNFKIDFTLPFRQWLEREGSVKSGYYYSTTRRLFEERTYDYRSQTGDAGFAGGGQPNDYLDPAHLGYQTVLNARGQTNYVFDRYLSSSLGNSSYEGSQKVDAYYGMAELPVHEKLKLIGGARVENTFIEIVGTPPIEQTDVLPALGAVWAIRTNMNLRLNYGNTLARPAFRELASVRVYDVTDDTIIEGNPGLKLVDIKNYDVRWEWFPRLGEVLSVGLFYKDLKNPIEKYSRTLDDGIITFTNRPSAIVFGVEVEARKSLDFLHRDLANLTFGANFSWIYSETELFDTELKNKRSYDPSTPAKRPLYDQSPYIMNFDLTYNNPSSGTLASLSANLAGPRIYYATGAGPDVYEHPPIGMDLVLSQRLTRHWKLKFGVRNLLDSAYERTYGDAAGVNTYSIFRGRTYGVSLSCDY